MNIEHIAKNEFALEEKKKLRYLFWKRRTYTLMYKNNCHQTSSGIVCVLSEIGLNLRTRQQKVIVIVLTAVKIK